MKQQQITKHDKAAEWPAMRDHVDQLIHDWQHERPDLAVSPLAVVMRVGRLAATWSAEIEAVLNGAGLTSTDFAVLANLRRAGAPYRLSQRQLAKDLRLASGTISLRIDKMETGGLVTRSVPAEDARLTMVTLTDRGAALFDQIAPAHLANEERLLAALSAEDRTTLGQLLRALVIDVEQPAQHRPDERLGFRAAAASTAAQRRTQLALDPVPGLLVEFVAVGGAAARAGLRVGDVVVAAGNVSMYALTDLESALGLAAETLRLSLRRGDSVIHVALQVATSRGN